MKTNQNSPLLNQPELRLGISPANPIRPSQSSARPVSLLGNRKRHMILPPDASDPALCPTRAKVLIVDNTPIFCLCLENIINSQPDLAVCGRTNPFQAVSAIEDFKPDAVIINVADPIHLVAVKDIATQCPKMPILAYSFHGDEILAERALRSGAKGYVSHKQSIEDWVDSIKQILNGQFSMSSVLANRMIELGINGNPLKSPHEKLSTRELAVFHQIGLGRGTRQIAADFGVSIKTIESHRWNLKQKLRVSTTPQLVLAAVEWVRTLS